MRYWLIGCGILAPCSKNIDGPPLTCKVLWPCHPLPTARRWPSKGAITLFTQPSLPPFPPYFTVGKNSPGPTLTHLPLPFLFPCYPVGVATKSQPLQTC